MNTYIFDVISPEAKAYAEQHLDRVIMWDDPLIQDYTQAEAVIVRTFKMNAEVIDKMPNLKIIAKHGVGVDNIDVAYAKQKGILVTNTPLANMNSVAELIIALSLNCARKVNLSHNSVLQGISKNSPLFLTGCELSEKNIGLVGLGKIGSLVGQKFQAAFGANILVYDPFVSEDACAQKGFKKAASLEELCRQADIISVSIPLTAQTKNLISKKELDLMKPTAILINTARGGIVNEADLYGALISNRIFGAALDVFETEPVGKEHPLLSCTNFIALPHNGANTNEALIRMGLGAVDEIVRYQNGQPPLCSL